MTWEQMEAIEQEGETIFHQLATLTKAGKIDWICDEYNPLCIMDKDRVEEKPAYLTHSFSCHAFVNSIPHTVEITEYITIPDGKGDITIDLERGFPDELRRFETSLSHNFDEYDDCKPDELLEHFADDPVTEFADAVIPLVVQSDAVKFTFTWARFVNEKSITKRMLSQPLVKLANQLFDTQNILDFHRIVLDTAYRAELMDRTSG